MALDEQVKLAGPEPTQEEPIPDDAEVGEEGDDDGPNGEPSSVADAIAAVAAGSDGKSKKKKKGKAKAALQKLKPGGDVKLEDKMTDELQQSIVDNVRRPLHALRSRPRQLTRGRSVRAQVRKANGEEAAGQLASLNRKDLGRLLDQLNVLDVAQGKAGIGGKNRKDMGEYKFWGTQPVRRLDDSASPPRCLSCRRGHAHLPSTRST